VDQHDGTTLRLHKIDPDYDPCDRITASNHVPGNVDSCRKNRWAIAQVAVIG